MRCTPVGSGVQRRSAVEGSGVLWLVQVVLTNHTWNQMHCGVCPEWAGVALVFINEYGAAPGPPPASGNLPGLDGHPYLELPSCL